MIKDITLGQFFPGKSFVHKLDPRTKLIASILYIVAVFSAKNVFCFLALALSIVILDAVSGISPKTLLRGIKPILYVLIFTVAISIFWTKGETLLVDWGPIEIYLEGIYRALLMALRVIVLIMGTSLLLTYTTSPIVLTDGLEALLKPLKYIKVPVHSFSMMMTIALRFIPTLIEETDKIMSAQKARGADFSNGGIIKRARALIPVLVPLFVSAFKRAEELAIAMECRCYRGGDGRTKMTKLKFRFSDFVMIFLFAAFIAAIILGNRYIPIGFSI